MKKVMKKVMKKFVCLTCLFSLLVMQGCAGKTEQGEKGANTKEDSIQIGFCFDTFVVERWQRDRDVFVSTATELGAEVNVQNANGSVEKQIEQIQYLIDKEVDAILIVAIDSYQLTDVIEKARKQGIIVIAYDRLIYATDIDLYISFDNEAVGRLMAEALASVLDYGDQVLMLCGPVTDSNVSFVESGFVESMAQNHLTIADKTYLDGWKAELAADYLDAYQNLDKISAIMCGNDNIAGKVIWSLSEKRMTDSIYVVGQDADLEACQRIVEGTQLMTVYKPVDKLAQAAAEYTVALILGQEEKTEETINNGLYEISYIRLEPIAVTIENIDEIIIESAFHTREDVYRNVQN